MTTNRLQELREARTEARTEIATLCGVTERTVERWESEATAIPDSQKQALTEHFQVSVEHLLGWDRTKAAA